jgi:uncharacterized C2H2 Zn-finger protein
MTQENSKNRTWTWDIFHHYHKCPECGYILEDRSDFVNYQGIPQKNLHCSRCNFHFKVQKKPSKALGPLW